MISKKDKFKFVLGKSYFRSDSSFYSYADVMNAEEKRDEKIKNYLFCSRTELHIRYPNQCGHYSITWEKNRNESNNLLKIEKIIFRLKPSNTCPEGASCIYGINFITQNEEIKRQAKIKKQENSADITIKQHWGKWYEIDYHPPINENENIATASKNHINDIANIFLTDIIEDKDAVKQYQNDIAHLYYFHFNAINPNGKNFYLHRFFKEEDGQSIPKIPTSLKKITSTYCY